MKHLFISRNAISIKRGIITYVAYNDELTAGMSDVQIELVMQLIDQLDVWPHQVELHFHTERPSSGVYAHVQVLTNRDPLSTLTEGFECCDCCVTMPNGTSTTVIMCADPLQYILDTDIVVDKEFYVTAIIHDTPNEDYGNG